MKKSILFLFALTITSAASAQWWGSKKVNGNGKVTTETRKVGDYDTVSMAGFFDVVLVKGSEGKITIEAEENLLEYIVTEVDGDQLKIKTEKGYNLSTSRGKKILITVPFEDISGVYLSGSGDIVSKNEIKATNFTTSLSGSGDIKLSLNSDTVEANVSGSGDISVTGYTSSFECAISGSGDIHAYDLKAKDVSVSISGSGDAKVHCNGGKLKTRIVGSGDVKYQGNPGSTDNKIVGSGDVTKI
ncbi:Putative auto-transporter adhesin, head GIN domain [Zhouia amylolytica]|uniref:Putative auto-transporter adhesin head GIN domain-containing protein n=2 Tax=Zhouia amylolytica TaxID=376730 RepID=W2UT96_9FLAO|nr:head GIN domain-containing protein [Zhouia amylolytica]ETN96557.1 hypothetical protein P278_06350 [Zhouia amylolytica AD3]MCQ0109957.1 DUF2807 domain-containing protein [Zhouia amylolytica]SFT09890.1 Putative auto-transporter adhesin, head GIN domain [Zhouia amylolytica]